MKTRTAMSALALVTWLLAAASLVSGQYPATFQVTKDGTSIVIEDYAAVPPSSLMREGPYPAPLDPRGQVNRVNGVVSEPVGAPRSAARFFVDRKSTRLNSSHVSESRMPSSA